MHPFERLDSPLGRADQMNQMAGGSGIGAVQHPSHQFDGVPAAAAGEAVPQAAGKVDPKGGGIVASVQGARTGKSSSLPHQPFVEPVEREDVTDPDSGLQRAKVELRMGPVDLPWMLRW